MKIANISYEDFLRYLTPRVYCKDGEVMRVGRQEEFFPLSPMGMGSCFGRCLQNESRPPCTIYFNGSDNVIEFDNLVDNIETHQEQQHTRFHGLSALLSLRRAERTQTRRLFLEMMECPGIERREGSVQHLLESSTESLQVLDARTLAYRAAYQIPATRSSTPGSFLELEWELEGLSPPQIPQIESPEHHLSTQCSRVSSPPSLEWDLVDCEVDCVTHEEDETEQLINEIERLTQQALQETGLSLTSTAPV